MKPNTKAKLTQKDQAESVAVSPVTSKASTNGTPNRPGRRRKPTQKAAELAANSSSKLFKSIATKQINDDGTSFADGDHDFEGERVSRDEDTVTPAPASEEAARKVTEQGGIEKVSGSAPDNEIDDGPSDQTTVERSNIGTTNSRPQKRRSKRIPQSTDEASVYKGKNVNTRATRSKNKPPAMEAHITPSDSVLIAESTEPSTDSPSAVTKDKIQDYPSPSKSKEATPPPKNSSPKKKKPKRPPEKTVEPTDPNTLTNIPSEPKTIIIATSTSTSTSHKPTRIKFKPLQATITTALAGYTSLPCKLSCLSDSTLFYMWAKIAIEREGLADAICSLEDEFDTNMSEEARKLRGKLNGVMAEFCECGRSGGIKSDGKAKKDNTG